MVSQGTVQFSLKGLQAISGHVTSRSQGDGVVTGCDSQWATGQQSGHISPRGRGEGRQHTSLWHGFVVIWICSEPNFLGASGPAPSLSLLSARLCLRRLRRVVAMFCLSLYLWRMRCSLAAAQSSAGGIFVNRCLVELLCTNQGCRETTAQWTPGPVQTYGGAAIPARCGSAWGRSHSGGRGQGGRLPG